MSENPVPPEETPTASAALEPLAVGGFLPPRVLWPIAALLVALFVLIRFPWDSVGRRVAWEISRVSGARVEVDALSPALTARGPVLRATDVTIEHPAVERVRLTELELAPRLSGSWLSGEPTVRVWARTGLGNADGVLRLGETPAYQGRVDGVSIERLPLRLDASRVRIAGVIDADADVALAPDGTLSGRVDFESPSLTLESPQLPIAIPFSRAVGTIEILETGATRIAGVRLEGPIVEGDLDGEIGLVHRSQSPPLDLQARLRILDPSLRQLAPSAGLPLAPDGSADLRIGGTIDRPDFQPVGGPPPGPRPRGAGRRR